MSIVSELNEERVAKKFGLAQVEFQPIPVASALPSLNKSEALLGVDQGLQAICQSLSTNEKGLGTCWRDRARWPQEPVLKVKVWAWKKSAEEGNYAPACGTINLFGTMSSLFHEVAHAIDFQQGNERAPWSHQEDWLAALSDAPNFCGQLLEQINTRRRVRLSDIYLASPHEFFARAFECFIVERAGANWPHRPDCSCPKTYPQRGEREALNKIIETKVVAQLQKAQTRSD